MYSYLKSPILFIQNNFLRRLSQLYPKAIVFSSSIQFINLIIGFLTSVMSARFLGPSGRGEYFYITTLAMMLTQLGNLGLGISNTYLVSKQPNLFGKLFVNSFYISVLLGLSIAIITVLILNLMNGISWVDILVLMLLVPASIFYFLGVNLFIGINKIKMYNVFQISSNILLFLLMLCAGLSGQKVLGFLFASVFGWLLIGAFLFISLVKSTQIGIKDFRFDNKSFLLGANFGLKTYLITLLGLLVLKGNVFLLKYFSNDIDLGYFSIASQLNDCLIIIPGTANLILFPSLVRNQSDRWQEMMRHFRSIMVLMLITCILSMLLVEPFIKIAYGINFLPAAKIFLYLLPGSFFLGLISIISSFTSASDLPPQTILIWLIAFIIVMLASYVLIPLYDGVGAAVSLSIAYFSLFCMMWSLANKINKKGLNLL